MAAPIISGIYVIRNTVSGRVYVGSSINVEARMGRHKRHLRKGDHHSKPLQRSWDKHGEQAFSFELLEVISDQSALIGREQHWIDFLKSFHRDSGFNVAPVAGSTIGWKATDADRAKMRVAQLGKKHSPEHIAARATANRGKKRSIEVRLRMGAAQKNVSLSDEERRRRADVLRSITARPETHIKMSIAAKNRVVTLLTRKAMSEAQKARNARKRNEQSPLQMGLFE